MSRLDLAIDWTRCDGHGLCAAASPGRITLDEWGFPVLADGGRRLDDSEVRAARAAALVCPALALRLERVD